MIIFTNKLTIALILTCILSCSLFITSVFAAKKTGRKIYEDKQLLLRASTSKPEQLAAFYTGRGFTRDAINEINKTCFVTVVVKNKTYDVLWLILDDWAFYAPHGKALKRITRLDWKKTWQSIGLKQAYRSTFGWTQMPESRDLRADEHAAGNVAVPWQEEPFKLVATFRTGQDKSGPAKTIILENLQCTR